MCDSLLHICRAWSSFLAWHRSRSKAVTVAFLSHDQLHCFILSTLSGPSALLTGCLSLSVTAMRSAQLPYLQHLCSRSPCYWHSDRSAMWPCEHLCIELWDLIFLTRCHRLEQAEEILAQWLYLSRRDRQEHLLELAERAEGGDMTANMNSELTRCTNAGMIASIRINSLFITAVMSPPSALSASSRRCSCLSLRLR